MKKPLLFLILSTLLFSCTSILDKKFNEESTKDDMEELSENLDTADFQLLVGTMFRLKLENKELDGMSYNEILEEGRNWKAEQERKEAEQKALAEKAAKEEAERIKKLTNAVLVSCFEKGYQEVGYQEYITYKFVIQNKSNKAIRAIKGEILFTNLFDEEIKSLNFVYDQPIPIGEEVTWNASTEYNQFMDDDAALKRKNLKDLKVIWRPEKVIFEDGSSLE